MTVADPRTVPTNGVDRYVGPRQAAEILGLSPSYLEKLRITGRGPRFAKLSARTVRYKVTDLVAWADSKIVGSTSELAAA